MKACPLSCPPLLLTVLFSYFDIHIALVHPHTACLRPPEALPLHLKGILRLPHWLAARCELSCGFRQKLLGNIAIRILLQPGPVPTQALNAARGAVIDISQHTRPAWQRCYRRHCISRRRCGAWAVLLRLWPLRLPLLWLLPRMLCLLCWLGVLRCPPRGSASAAGRLFCVITVDGEILPEHIVA